MARTPAEAATPPAWTCEECQVTYRVVNGHLHVGDVFRVRPDSQGAVWARCDCGRVVCLIAGELIVTGPATEPDPVHPSHYRLPGGGELLDLIEGMPFCRGNAIKYLFRAGRKEGADELDDLRKAAVYVQREIARIEAGR